MRSVAILFTLLITNFCSADEKLFSFEKSEKLPSGLSYAFTLKEGIYRRPAGTTDNDCGMWGVDCGDPATNIQVTILKINGKLVHMPAKFFADLGNVHSVKVQETKNGLLILVRGGDASGAYTAHFRTNMVRLIERIVRHGEFPDENIEKTEITNDLIDHPENY